MSALAVPNLVEERRKHSQHRYIERLQRHEGDCRGGENVNLWPGADKTVEAIVPRRKGTPKIEAKLKVQCEGLPFFRAWWTAVK